MRIDPFMTGERHAQASSISESVAEYGRGLSGGLLFSLPLLYTMEVWWSGFIASPERLAGYLAGVFLLLIGYNRFAGMHPDTTITEVVIDSVEELGLGIVTSAAVLFLLGRIDPYSELSEAFGKIVVEAGMVAIGFSVGTAQLGEKGDEQGKEEGEPGKKAKDQDSDDAPGFANQLVISTCGAVLFAANVAPTEEIVLIAESTPPSRMLILMIFSLALAAIVLYFSGFTGSGTHARAESKVDVLMGTVITYAVALIASAVMLWFFGRFDGVAAHTVAEQVVVLGLPAVLGASAGRLLLQT